jgi:hypothetical protein
MPPRLHRSRHRQRHGRRRQLPSRSGSRRFARGCVWDSGKMVREHLGSVVVACIECSLSCCGRTQNIRVRGDLYREGQPTPHLDLGKKHPNGLGCRNTETGKHGLRFLLKARFHSSANNSFFHGSNVALSCHIATVFILLLPRPEMHEQWVRSSSGQGG